MDSTVQNPEQNRAIRLRRDPRWGLLMRDLGLADDWRNSGRPPDDRAWMGTTAR